jgi:hypothetical protein
MAGRAYWVTPVRSWLDQQNMPAPARVSFPSSLLRDANGWSH